MSNEIKALQEQAGLIVTDLAEISIKLIQQLNDPDTFSARVMAQRNDIDALEESLSKSFVELPDGRKLVSWEYETLEKFAKSNRLDFDRLLNHCVTILNGNVVEADINNKSVQDISALSGLTDLHTLDLRCNQIQDLSSLSGLINLQQLGLGGNQIQELSSLSGLTNLQRLGLDNNQINDLSSLSGLEGLKLLKLNFNQIQDISSLSGLTGLRELWLINNKIQDKETARKIITSLTERGVSVYV